MSMQGDVLTMGADAGGPRYFVEGRPVVVALTLPVGANMRWPR